MQGCPYPELQHESDSYDETVTLAHNNHTINNDEDFVSTDPCFLTPPIDYDFSCADFNADELSNSDITMTCDDKEHTVAEEPPPPEPPEPPPNCTPEITFASAFPILHELRNVTSACY